MAKTPDRLDDIYGVGLAKGGNGCRFCWCRDPRTGSEVPDRLVTTPPRKEGRVAPVATGLGDNHPEN